MPMESTRSVPNAFALVVQKAADLTMCLEFYGQGHAFAG